MMHKARRRQELDRMDTLTTIEAVAYVIQLYSRLKHDECTDEERKNGLELLERLMDRVGSLIITPEPAYIRTG